MNQAIVLVNGLMNAYESVSMFGEILLIAQFYKITHERMDDGSEDQGDYKILFIISGLLFCAKFYVITSTMNFMAYYEGENGANLEQGRLNIFHKILKFIKFTFLAPSIFIIMRFFLIIENVIMIVFLPLIILSQLCRKTKLVVFYYDKAKNLWAQAFNTIFKFNQN